MTQITVYPPHTPDSANEHDNAKQVILDGIDTLDSILREVNQKIHDCPELGYHEFQAHDNLTSLLESQSIPVTKHAYGLETAFEAKIGTGGRLITFCAEYDALPDVGHACGHNLIATASTSAFLGVVSALRKYPKITGRVRLLGTPAEEGGGGKIKLIEAGAFKDVDAALMVHPNPKTEINKDGTSYGTCLAATTFQAHFTGLTAHAGAMPWMGINALDAANLAYTAVGLLRQQCRPTDRINIIIKQEGDMPSNIIPDRATLNIGVRCATWKEVGVLRGKVENCIRGASIATGCEYTLEHGMLPYAEIRPNETICAEFTKAMAELGSEFICDLNNVERGGYGTDMGNVTYEVPGFHGTFSVPTRPGENIHGKGFTRAAGTDEAHKLAVKCGKGMALTAWKILVDDHVAECVRLDFENDKLKRS